MERLTVTGPAIGQEGLVPISIHVITLWCRSDLLQPDRGNARLKLLAPDGTQIGETVNYEVNLEEFPRARNITRFSAFAFRGSGIRFVVEMERNGTWSTVSRVPLEITLQDSAAQGGRERLTKPCINQTAATLARCGLGALSLPMFVFAIC
jgi:hypothetical protein